MGYEGFDSIISSKSFSNEYNMVSMNALQKLGFPDHTKLLIIHADDAGLAHSENQATMQALAKGQVNSCSIMMPCPWFYEMVEFSKHNMAYEYGIHLTLTCEWKYYKWQPVMPISEVPSLVDENGFMHRTRHAFKENATIEDVEKEAHAQIEKAFKYGLTPSHLDVHMSTLCLKPELISLYRQLGHTYKLPILLNKQLIAFFGVNPDDCLVEDDLCVDNLYVGEYKDFEKGQLTAYYAHVLENLPAGLNQILIHPAFNGREMQGITIEHPNFGAEWRQMDYDYFTSVECRSILEKNNIQLITWRMIKDILWGISS